MGLGSVGMHRTNMQNTTVQRNENEAIKHEDKEAERPDQRIIGTVRSPSAERTGGLQGQILPVVEELGEANSVGGRSARSGTGEGSEKRPLTPLKDNINGRPPTPQKDWSPSLGGQNGTVRKAVSRCSLDKDLPPLPRNGELNEKGKGVIR